MLVSIAAEDAHAYVVVCLQGFWLECGTEALPSEGGPSVAHFVLTPAVRSSLRAVARALTLRRFPVLLQGPTSAGKTSLVEYIARLTGHMCVRINNHEHTDLQVSFECTPSSTPCAAQSARFCAGVRRQHYFCRVQEYLGSYVTDAQGHLTFQEGALVRAARCGGWVILDELNLAPTDVLEALNRLLDDNRELFVPELQEVIVPHPHFMVFGTQNPPGTYAGAWPVHCLA